MEIKLEKIEFGKLSRSVIFLYGSEVAMRSLPFKREEAAYVEERRKSDISSLVVLNRLPEKLYVQNFDSEKPSGETLEGLRYKSATAISRMGIRSVVGNVIAVYAEGRRMLVKTAEGQIVGADLRSPTDIGFGESVAAAGFPETDLFIINLTKAICRRVPGERLAAQEPQTLPEQFAMEGVLRDICAHGGSVRIRGRTIGPEDGGHVFDVLHGGHAIRVDFSAVAAEADAISPDNLVEVAGTCVRNTSGDVSDGFPRTMGFTLVPRTASDLHVVAGAPWWTVGRMLAVVLVLDFAEDSPSWPHGTTPCVVLSNAADDSSTRRS